MRLLCSLDECLVVLQLMQAGVDAVLGQQFFVTAFFAQLAPMQHEDFVGAADGGQAMGDDDGGAVAHQFFHGLLDPAFGLGVDVGGGFVEHQNVRVRS